MATRKVIQAACDFAGDRTQGGGHGFPSYTASLIEKGYLKGYEDAQKKLYSKKDLKIAYENGQGNGAQSASAVAHGKEINLFPFAKWLRKYKKKKNEKTNKT